MRVLVVDDDEGIRSLVRVALEGHEVVEASDGPEALELLRADSVDVVLLDVMMPNVDGFEALARIRRSERTRDVPVLMLTAKVAEADHVRAFRAGADGYLTKPFDVEELARRVEQLAAMTPEERAQARKDELGRAELLRQIEHRFAG